MSFQTALEEARAARIPVMALRPDGRFPDELDDIVVEGVETFRAEAMADDVWWLACYFANGERLTFSIYLAKKPKRIVMRAEEMPSEWLDWDEMFRTRKKAV